MSLEEIQSILNPLFRYGFEVSIAGIIAFILMKFFLFSYLSEKGKNLATKEDIELITNKVESIKSAYAEVLEEVRSNNQIKIDAISREMTLKKEVYMDAVEAITRAQNIIASFSNLNLDEESITSKFSLEAGKIAKVQIVGSGETVKAVTVFMSAIGTAVLNLTSGRASLIQRKNLISINETQRNKAQSELDRYILIMKNFNLQGNTDPLLWETVNRSADYESEQVNFFQNEIDSLYEIQKKEHFEFVETCMKTFFDISYLLPNAVLAVRRELNLEIEPHEYLAIFNENIEVGKRVISDFLHRIKNS